MPRLGSRSSCLVGQDEIARRRISEARRETNDGNQPGSPGKPPNDAADDGHVTGAGHAYMILDGTLIPTGRLARTGRPAPASTAGTG
jgi:hypothetical protein